MQEEREKEDEVLSMSMILKQSSEFKGYLFSYWYMYTHVILLQTQKKDREGGGGPEVLILFLKLNRCD